MVLHHVGLGEIGRALLKVSVLHAVQVVAIFRRRLREPTPGVEESGLVVPNSCNREMICFEGSLPNTWFGKLIVCT